MICRTGAIPIPDTLTVAWFILMCFGAVAISCNVSLLLPAGAYMH